MLKIQAFFKMKNFLFKEYERIKRNRNALLEHRKLFGSKTYNLFEI